MSSRLSASTITFTPLARTRRRRRATRPHNRSCTRSRSNRSCARRGGGPRRGHASRESPDAVAARVSEIAIPSSTFTSCRARQQARHRILDPQQLAELLGRHPELRRAAPRVELARRLDHERPRATRPRRSRPRPCADSRSPKPRRATTPSITCSWKRTQTCSVRSSASPATRPAAGRQFPRPRGARTPHDFGCIP